MKRFDEMDERELMEVRAKMTPEEIMAVVQEEEEEMERLVKGAQILEPSIAHEEQEDDSIVQFNPETGEAVEVESTIVTRETEGPSESVKRKGMVTIVEQEEADFSYFDMRLIHKAIGKMISLREEEEEKTYSFNHGQGMHWMTKRTTLLNQLEKELRDEIIMLRRIRNLCQAKTMVSVREKETHLKKEVEELPKDLINELNDIVSNLATELLDIL